MFIEAETENDQFAIRRVTIAAFEQPDEADLVDALRSSCDAIISLIAKTDDGEIIGHILFSKFQSPDQCLALAPVSVHPDHQNTGVGTKLVTEGLARAKQEGWLAVFVLGEPDYYGRFGFSAALADKFDAPFPKPYFMALELLPGILDKKSGIVIYAEPFQI